MSTYRAVIDRIIAALAVALGVQLPVDTPTLVAALLVAMAAIDGYLRWRERKAAGELLDRAEIADDESNQKLLAQAGLSRAGRLGSPGSSKTSAS